MKQVTSIEIADIIKNDILMNSLNDELIIMELNGQNINKLLFKQNEQVHLEALSVFLMLNGTLDVNIDGIDYHFETTVLLDILELHIVQNLKMSPDFRGYHVIINRTFMAETMRDIKRLPISNFISRCNYPVEKISREEALLLEEIILKIIKNITKFSHFHQRDLIKNELRSFFMELSNIVIQRNPIVQDNVLRNKNEIIGEFIHLLNKNCKKEHSVDFYAKKIGIDAKYLSRILKSLNGKSASAWIDEAIFKEAKIYLLDAEINIQEIADALHFSDQSAFGKFFKKHSGSSPVMYRKKQ